MNVVELHVFTDTVSGPTTKEAAEKLTDFCEKNNFPIIRLFWRGVEPDDTEE